MKFQNLYKMDIWGESTNNKNPPVKEVTNEHPMDVLIKDDKQTKHIKDWQRCRHVWKEIDSGRVHKGRYGMSHQWFQCKLCKRKQRRNTRKKKS